ncbi:unnamed protein product [Leptidea sinapis]|uniref:Uncharacterized protein n=1 Tax=Leptidea sinapis TaxID=189913 RepID=A0A5E4PQQ1_9NEOP|nr:unnamed protein product [Leptidea sinapis]
MIGSARAARSNSSARRRRSWSAGGGAARCERTACASELSASCHGPHEPPEPAPSDSDPDSAPLFQSLCSTDTCNGGLKLVAPELSSDFPDSLSRPLAFSDDRRIRLSEGSSSRQFHIVGTMDKTRKGPTQPKTILKVLEKIGATLIKSTVLIQCDNKTVTAGNPIKEGHILKCTRIAKLNKDSPRPRTILVKFFSPIIRDQFYASITKFNKNKTKDDRPNTSHLGLAGEKQGVFIMEHLSPEAKALHAQARNKLDRYHPPLEISVDLGVEELVTSKRCKRWCHRFNHCKRITARESLTDGKP